jgi:hypothetical protein
VERLTDPKFKEHQSLTTPMPVHDILNFAKEYPAILSLACFFIGLYIGNKLAIGRDRRKEFNKISENAFITLNKQIEHLKFGSPGQCINDFLLIDSYVPFYKRWFFRKHVKNYKEAQQDLSIFDLKTGSATFNQEKMAQLSSSAKALLCYLSRR